MDKSVPHPDEWHPLNREERKRHNVPKQVIDQDGLDRVLKFIGFIDADLERLKEGAANIKEEMARVKKLREKMVEHYAPHIKMLYDVGELAMVGKGYVSGDGRKVEFRSHKTHIHSISLRKTPTEILDALNQEAAEAAEKGEQPEHGWLIPFVVEEVETVVKVKSSELKKALEKQSQDGDGFPVDDPFIEVIEQPDLTIKF